MPERREIVLNVYKWKAVQYPISAETAYHELQRIKNEYGKLTPEVIELSARSPDSPIHDCFCWDDTEAARKWRQQQARVLTVSISVTKVDSSSTTKPVNAFVHIQKEYKPIEVALNNRDYTREMLDNACREMRVFMSKYQTLSELSGVFDSMKKVMRAV